MNSIKDTPIVLIGGGGHASVLADTLLKQKRKIAAIISPNDIKRRLVFSGIRQLFNDEDILEFKNDEVLLVNGIGIVPKSDLRYRINEYFLSLGYKFTAVISSDALVSEYALIREGAQILPRAIVQAGAEIGEHTIINSGALVEHDSLIGMYCHIAPNVTICGEVHIGNEVYVGAGATIINSLELADQVVVGAGTTIVRDIVDPQVIVSAKNRVLD
ncbi:shikimate dehydrogenase [Marinomonas sp. CT5]|uniref:acetyltransferase n=1 Tax=Marinomonas sp. CT5 TaxID=2066133 RepID=UPI001BAEE953|nr:acetyltransferase [Marinomonas sp. CT5]QUX94504.1 shikimate dehydrogenase [Marinomonas sp. CT5]